MEVRGSNGAFYKVSEESGRVPGVTGRGGLVRSGLSAVQEGAEARAWRRSLSSYSEQWRPRLCSVWRALWCHVWGATVRATGIFYWDGAHLVMDRYSWGQLPMSTSSHPLIIIIGDVHVIRYNHNNRSHI